MADLAAGPLRIRTDATGQLQWSPDAGTTWITILREKLGADLTGLGAGDVNINPGTDKASEYRLPLGTPLTANRVLNVLLGGSPITNHVVKVTVYDTSAFTLTVKDDAGTTIGTFSANQTAGTIRRMWIYYNGTHFAPVGLIEYLA